jgi:drug/metabolite transporter (DMT)-like permease
VALLYGVIAALLLGCSDFCASRAARTVSAVAVTRTNMAVSMLIGPFLLLLRPWQWSAPDVGRGALAGLVMASGLLLLYRGYEVARIGIVGPTSSVVLGVLPVLWDVARGRPPSTVVLLGMAIAVAALVPATWTPGGTGSIARGLRLGAVSGVLFSVAFVLMSSVSEPAGLLPLWVQRACGFTLLAVLQPFEKSPLVVVSGPAKRWAWGAGLGGMSALTALQLGYALPGGGSIVSVSAAQFATVLVVLAWIFNRERLRSWQWVGVLASGVGVGIMAAG